MLQAMDGAETSRALALDPQARHANAALDVPYTFSHGGVCMLPRRRNDGSWTTGSACRLTCTVCKEALEPPAPASFSGPGANGSSRHIVRVCGDYAS